MSSVLEVSAFSNTVLDQLTIWYAQQVLQPPRAQLTIHRICPEWRTHVQVNLNDNFDVCCFCSMAKVEFHTFA
jgi:hypothetical protein